MKKLKVIIGLMLIVACAFGQEAEGISNVVRVNFKAKDVSAPDIFMIYKNSGEVTSAGLVEVDIRVLDDGGIGTVKINQEERSGAGKDTLVFAYSFMPGQEVAVLARDNSNNVKEKSFLIKGQQATPAAIAVAGPKQHRYYALLIGVEEYEDPEIASLSEPVKDATMLREVLTSKYTFNDENIKFLKNPTNADLIITFEELSREIGPEDFLLIFYAGHGFYNDKTNIGYWLPADARKANTVKWFRNSALVENMGAINSKHTLLISDACFSGGIFKTRAPFNNASPDIADMLKRPSRKAMTSGSLTTVPDKSVFMRYLLKVLNENNNQYLPSEELFDEIRLSMRNNSNTKPLYGEIQNVGDEGGNFVFIQKQ
jgi:hypothetical protein